MASLSERLLKTSSLDHTAVLADSDIYNNRSIVPTPIPALNIAYSADVTGGLGSGLTVWAGPSKHFKTLFCLISAASYLKKYPDAVCMFYDSEFGSPVKYFISAGIDPKRVIHVPIVSLEELRTELANLVKEIKRGEHVVIVVDSMGNLASEKEIKDAEDGSDKADLTRARVGKSIFRIVTPHLRLKDIPMLVVAHTYDTLEMYSKKVVSGGTGIYYSADNLYIVGRQQEKDKDKDLVGYNFMINVEKSRYTREKSVIPITVLFDGGVMKWSGLFDIAVEGGYLTKIAGTKSDHAVINAPTGEVVTDTKFTKADENNGQLWKLVFEETDFTTYIQNTFAVSTGSLISEELNISSTESQEDE